MTPTGKKEFSRAMKVNSDKTSKSDHKSKNLKGILKNRRVEALAGGRGSILSEKFEGGSGEMDRWEMDGCEGWTLLPDAPKDWTLTMSFRVW